MKGKIGGIVRQIEAGDELSGSIINPHPLLFNILKSLARTHTLTHAHTQSRAEPSGAALQRCRLRGARKRAALTILLMLKASAASQRS